ncbi:hypothetical protein AX17_005694 [Amanita inopinata Kibby_2008]|nr:hypothetical protein AX17_005694 [Amanita inopinata Kibby_2008]
MSANVEQDVWKATDSSLDTPPQSLEHASQHPLKSAGLASGSADAGVTRPHLSRITQDPSPDRNNCEHESDNGYATDTQGSNEGSEATEKEVIVHKVTAKDSLAGVSLKYGIPLAELRRVNHLWASDSIHLRDVLFIPVEKALRTLSTQNSSTFSNTSDDNDSPHSTTNIVEGTHRPNVPTSATIQRIPASQLSFFPPTKSKPLNAQIHSLTAEQPSPFSTSSTPPRASSRNLAPHSSSLTSLLTALPIAASTRDDIVARLSFDSISSSFDDKSAGQFTNRENLELEDVTAKCLDNEPVSPKVPSRAFPSEEEHGDVRTPKVDDYALYTGKIGIPQYNTASPNISRHVLSSSPPSSYIPPSASLSLIRTVQLEPSPIMQIPKVTNGNLSYRAETRNSRRKTRKMESKKFGTTVYTSTLSLGLELQDTSKKPPN